MEPGYCILIVIRYSSAWKEFFENIILGYAVLYNPVQSALCYWTKLRSPCRNARIKMYVCYNSKQFLLGRAGETGFSFVFYTSTFIVTVYIYITWAKTRWASLSCLAYSIVMNACDAAKILVNNKSIDTSIFFLIWIILDRSASTKTPGQSYAYGT